MLDEIANRAFGVALAGTILGAGFALAAYDWYSRDFQAIKAGFYLYRILSTYY